MKQLEKVPVCPHKKPLGCCKQCVTRAMRRIEALKDMEQLDETLRKISYRG